MPDIPDAHYRSLAKAITSGRVVPFLGAGANLCGRPAGISWKRGEHLPSSRELAEDLAEYFEYPSDESQDLGRVSQYVALTSGTGPLYDRMREVFDANYPPTPLHRFLASIPEILRQKNYQSCYQLIVTTNYDDSLERAFQTANEPFDLVSYITEGDERGKFVHTLPGGEARPIEKPNEYLDLNLDQRSVILKVHGAVNRADPERDSFMITEDHYIDYLTRTELSNLVPVGVAAKLQKSHFLFLGYSLQDWNLRVIFHRIWGQQKLNFKSWAIQLNPQELDKKFWQVRDVDILDVDLDNYVASVASRLEELPPFGGDA